MTIVSALASFAVVAGLLTLVPGVDTALVLRAALTRGRAHAVATAAGINTGLLVWGAASAVGVSALLTASQAAFTVLRLAGAGYLVWLGVGLLRRSRQQVEDVAGDVTRDDAGDGVPPAAPTARRPGSIGRAWRRGLLTNLLNPKVGVFYLMMIPQFLPPGAPHLLMGLLLALVHVTEGLVWFTVVITVTTLVRRRLAGERVRQAIDQVTGVVLIGFGARLLTSP